VLLIVAGCVLAVWTAALLVLGERDGASNDGQSGQ
jgi:hypothetical protein